MNFISLKKNCTRLKTGKKKIEESLSLPTNLSIRPIEFNTNLLYIKKGVEPQHQKCTKYKSALEFSIKLPYTKFSFL